MIAVGKVLDWVVVPWFYDVPLLQWRSEAPTPLGEVLFILYENLGRADHLEFMVQLNHVSPRKAC